MLHHYQLQVSQFENITPLAPIPFDKTGKTPNTNKFHKPKNYVKINKTIYIVDDQVVYASLSVATYYSIF